MCKGYFNMGRKRIFVSDIHMNDYLSLHPGAGLNPYGWLHTDHATRFADFLVTVLKDTDVCELVILGDLFDEWLRPAEFNLYPDSYFQQIATAKQNIPIINNLKRIINETNIDITYVNGNHDMLLSENVLNGIIPGIIFEHSGKYKKGNIAAEHGHNYCFFNTRDLYSNPDHMLPAGYFITRSVASLTLNYGKDIKS